MAERAGTLELENTTQSKKVVRSRRNEPRKTHKERPVGYLFVAPFALLFTLVFIIPIGYSIYISFFQTRMMGGNVFVGLQNYFDLFKDAHFWNGVGRVVGFTVIQVPIMLILSILLALAIDSMRLHGTKFIRITVFMPYAVPAVVTTLMWGFILGTKYGLFKSFNDFFGTSVNPFSPDWTIVSIGVMVTWAFTGYDMLIFYSALKTVPQELYEAAAIDGANEWKIIWNIKLPQLKGSLVITIIFSIIGSFQLFNEPKILQGMMQGTGITTYYTPNLYAYNLAFTGSQQGYAAALAIVMALITIAIAYAVQIQGMKKTED